MVNKLLPTPTLDESLGELILNRIMSERESKRIAFKKPIIKAQGNSAEVLLYGDIGGSMFDDGIGAVEFIDTVNRAGKIEQLDVRINSSGGDVFEGFAIYNYLLRQKAKVNVHIDGMALSIASGIAMAGDTRTMAENALMMMHYPWTMVVGNAEDMRHEAKILDKVGEGILQSYERRMDDGSGLHDMLTDEKWLTAKEAVDIGLATDISEPLQIAASFDLSRFKHPSIDALQRAKKHTIPVDKYKPIHAKLVEFMKTLN